MKIQTGVFKTFSSRLLFFSIVFVAAILVDSCQKGADQYGEEQNLAISNTNQEKGIERFKSLFGLNREIQISVDLKSLRYFHKKDNELWIGNLIKGNLGFASSKVYISYKKGTLSVMLLAYDYDVNVYQKGNLSSYNGTITVYNQSLEKKKTIHYLHGRITRIVHNGPVDIEEALCGNCFINHNWCLEFPPLCDWYGEGSGAGGVDENDSSAPPDNEDGGNVGGGASTVTLEDINNFRNISEAIQLLEIGAGISSSNFFSFVFLGNSSETILTSNSFKIYINQNKTVEQAIISYTHELSNASNSSQLRTLMENAASSPKNEVNRTAFADGCASVEAKGVMLQVLVAYEQGIEQSLGHPVELINTIADYYSNTGTMSLEEVLAYVVNAIKNGNALDDEGNNIYQGYIDFYNGLP